MRVITWRDRRWRAEEHRDGWRLLHGSPQGGYVVRLQRATLDQVVAFLLDQGVDPEGHLDDGD